MKNLETLYKEIMESEELKAKFLAAAKEKKLGEFLKAEGCDATEEEIVKFLKEGREGELSDQELGSVSGGCNTEEVMISIFFVGGVCAIEAIRSATKDTTKEDWGDGRILCDENHKDW